MLFKEGIEHRSIEIVKNMLNENADNLFISKITGLTIEEIEKLYNIYI
ncbi:MAG: hypothetical protein IJB83_02160 [Bacilli bacterium]|nr:hypothetical protein [Bacilli bacterium]